MAGAELLPGMETAMDAIIVARLSCRGRSMPPKRPDGDLPSEWEDNDLIFPYFPIVSLDYSDLEFFFQRTN